MSNRRKKMIVVKHIHLWLNMVFSNFSSMVFILSKLRVKRVCTIMEGSDFGLFHGMLLGW